MKFNKGLNRAIFYLKDLLSYVDKSTAVRIVSVLLIINCSCKKFIEVQPPTTSINSINVFTNDASAIAVLTGIYTSMANEVLPNGITAMAVLPSLSSDELSLYDKNNATYLAYYKNSLTPIHTTFWNALYTYIFKANAALEGLNSNSDKLTLQVYQQLLGEAMFIRSFCYFYLVNLYGDVPLTLTSNPNINRSLAKAPSSEIYQKIIDDLVEAQNYLSENFLDGSLLNISGERVRPSKLAATALLARVYLYTNNWANAEVEATKLIVNQNLKLSGLNEVFLKASLNNKEAIWQLQPTGSGNSSNTKEGRIFILPTTGPSPSFPILLSDTLLNSFEANDQRKVNWVGKITLNSPTTITYYYPLKYKIGSVNTANREYSMIFRLGEQFLIRSEARAKQNKLQEAIADLDSIRKRSSLPLISATNPGINQSALLDKIIHERQVELFTEWGHRWFDLKRIGKIDALMSFITPTKGGTWSSNWSWYPIPQTDLDRDPALEQNFGY